MSAIQGWVTDHDEGLVEIAGRSGLVPEVVHLAAVLVLGGFTDDEIRDQLAGLEIRLRDGHDPLAGLGDALARIREITPGTRG